MHLLYQIIIHVLVDRVRCLLMIRFAEKSEKEFLPSPTSQHEAINYIIMYTRIS